MFAVIKALTADGIKIGIAEMPVEPQFCFEQNLSEEEAVLRCEEIAKKLNIPMYEGDCMFVDYVEIKEDERNVQ